MLIPIDRPLIDGRNIREAATQIASAGFIATHNQRPVLLITGGGANYSSDATTPIQAGVRDGQQLTIVMVDDADRTSISNGGNCFLSGTWNTGDLFGEGMWMKLVWDAANSRWIELTRGVKANTNEGKGSHAEGKSNTASTAATTAHVEGSSNTVTGISSHAEGQHSTASGLRDHAEGRSEASGSPSHSEGYYGKADQFCEHAQGGGRFTSTGDAQLRRFVCRRAIIPDAGGDVIGLNDTANGPIIPADSTWTFRAEVVGQTVDAGSVCSWSVEGCIKRVGAAAAICTIQAVNIIHVDDASIILTVAVPVGDTLDLTVTDADAAAGPYRFVATIHVTQITFT